MIVIRSAQRMRALSRRFEQQRKRVGVVPTMGALHEGHLSLIRAAAKTNDVVILTIFVNPLQFAPQEDFTRYPRPFARDAKLARQAGAQIIFAPTTHELYPNGFQTTVAVGALAQRWEGASRPEHFHGVATVVTLLFQLARPTTAYVGQKDYQQAIIIQQLVRDLQFPITVRVLPIVREADGLAMSSRNMYLNASEREQAKVLSQALELASTKIHLGERKAAPVIDAMRRLISEAPSARIDYVAIADANTLEPCWRLRGRVVLLLAVWIGRTRLIDNLLVDVR